MITVTICLLIAHLNSPGMVQLEDAEAASSTTGSQTVIADGAAEGEGKLEETESERPALVVDSGVQLPSTMGQPGGMGTKCLGGPIFAFARPAAYDSGCPATFNLGGGHSIETDGDGGGCGATASCNGGGNINCFATAPGSCEATRSGGDGYVDCNGQSFSCP